MSSDDKCNDSSCLSYNSDDISSTETKKYAKYNGIINVYLNGEILAYRTKTLCGDMTSKLARDLSDNIWVEEHTIMTENGKACILMEYPGADFKALVEHFHLKNVIGEGTKKAPLSNNESEYTSILMGHIYGDDFVVVRSLCCDIDSIIISSKVDKDKITEWLGSAGKTETPTLLYRASRDGWDASDFHRMCDGKGATVTVVKSSDGYIFGGYTDVAWRQGEEYESSAVSFLFSLKDHAGVGPVKMSIKSDKTASAILQGSNYGPTFGNDCDLYVASNANTKSSSYCNVDCTYQRPSNIDDPYFLTGAYNFTASDYEVFLV